MIKIKCVSCGNSNVYGDDGNAYMDGWYYRDGSGPGFPYNSHAVQICLECQRKEKLLVLVAEPIIEVN